MENDITETLTQIITDTDSSQDNSLEEAIENLLVNTEGVYGIYVQNFKTNETFEHQADLLFETASLYKLWILGESFRQIKSGVLSEDEVLTGDVARFNETLGVATDEAELKEGSVSMSVSDALVEMITVSDNYSALLLSDRLRLSNVVDFMDQNGFVKSHLGGEDGLPESTPKEMALFFEKLYKGKIIDSSYSGRMIALLKEQELNGKIPKYLPENQVIAHKTGELGNNTHDAGIVYADNGDYIIVVMSRTSDPDLAIENIATISKRVFDLFGNE